MEEGLSRVSSVESADSSVTKKRRKRKWDQPAEILVSTGVTVPVILPDSVLANSIGAIPSLFRVAFTQPLTTAAAPKINQPKIQDELIAREIVINDAESAIRCKLTKRQTQEEIQRCSGAIVITRGKYHPPNVPVDNEKPLYLHISAGAHLETTVERIKAVDLAAAMVEETMKQTSIANLPKVVHPFNISVFLGFEADPSLNVAARIRGPNDQYVNHITNETGALVVLRGRGSGNSGSSFEEEQQPLHLFLSSSNPQSLERAKLLAENLLDTISREFGASRISSNVYGAVPPPLQLPSPQNLATSTPIKNAIIPPVSSAIINTGPVLRNSVPSFNNKGTNYYGYGGIYPQATPLQQVALALRQSSSSSSSSSSSPSLIINSTSAQATTAPISSERVSSEKERRRRKFQELPAASNGSPKTDQNLFQGATFLKQGEPEVDTRERHNISTVLSPKKLAQSAANYEMPPPPPRMMPPPPKFPKNNQLDKSNQESIPDTLIKLVEYGEEDDDDEDEDETTEKPCRRDSNGLATSKPFWAV